MRCWRSAIQNFNGSDFAVRIAIPGYLASELKQFKPDIVHVMVEGRIVRSGGPEIALQLEEEGYASGREAEEKTAAV